MKTNRLRFISEPLLTHLIRADKVGANELQSSTPLHLILNTLQTDYEHPIPRIIASCKSDNTFFNSLQNFADRPVNISAVWWEPFHGLECSGLFEFQKIANLISDAKDQGFTTCDICSTMIYPIGRVTE